MPTKDNDRMEYIGQRIVAVRRMTNQELKDQGWEPSRFRDPAAVILENGAMIFASMDEEGNGPGCLFGRTRGGTDFYVEAEG